MQHGDLCRAGAGAKRERRLGKEAAGADPRSLGGRSNGGIPEAGGCSLAKGKVDQLPH